MMFQPNLILKGKIMQNEKIFLGADVSKLTIDFTVLYNNEVHHQSIANKEGVIKKFLQDLVAQHRLSESQLYLGVENTGRYSWPVLKVVTLTSANLYLLSPLHINKSQGLVRGKSDAVDSERIARFVRKNIDELSVYQKPREVIEQLGLLMARRDKLLRLIKAESATKEEMSHVSSSTVKSFILAESKRAIKMLKKSIQNVESQIQHLIKEDEQLTQKVKLLMSVPGVGKVLSWYLLVKTNEFKNFDDPRKLACYAGVAPFQHTSGTSVKGRTRVSKYADKTLKRILHMAALRVTQMKGELGDYYRRKVKEGKNKMAVINALRNKIIHRIMAVIRNTRPYQDQVGKSLVLS